MTKYTRLMGRGLRRRGIGAGDPDYSPASSGWCLSMLLAYLRMLSQKIMTPTPFSGNVPASVSYTHLTLPTNREV